MAPHNTGAVRISGKDDGCCGVFFLKNVLYVFNFIFWLSGLAVLAVGLWTYFMKHSYVSLLTTSIYTATTFLLMVTGGLILLIGIIGCCGAVKEHRCALMTYAAFLLVVFLLEAVIGVLAYVHEASVHEELQKGLKLHMQDFYYVDKEQTLAVEDLQQTFKCCGAESFMDWKESRWFYMQPGQVYNLTNNVPDCCCKSMSSNCAIRDHPSNIYYDGCIDTLSRFLQEHLIILGAVGIGVCCLQLFGIVFSCCLAKKIKDQQYSEKANYW